MRIDQSEARIQAGVIETLHFHGFRAFRVNSGLIRTRAGNFVRLAPKGTSDVVAMVPRSGRFLAAEIKIPGEQPTGDQREFLANILAGGGVAVVIDDVRRIDSIIAELKRDPWARFTTDGRPDPEAARMSSDLIIAGLETDRDQLRERLRRLSEEHDKALAILREHREHFEGVARFGARKAIRIAASQRIEQIDALIGTAQEEPH